MTPDAPMKRLIATTHKALRQALAAAGLDDYAGPLVVGVSGGPDSLALLDILAHLLPAERLLVAHLDHALRPTSADEAAAVAHEAAARGLRHVSERVDVATLARESGQSLEAAGRAARYDLMARVARAAGAATVLVGHNADDQTETVLLHLLRGAGPAGLRGMSLAAPLPGAPELWLLRPLLGVERAAIEAYCRATGLQPSHDASNTDPTFARNRLRHELLPLLKAYAPHLPQRLRETSSIAAAEDDLLSALEEASWRDVARPAPPDRVTLGRAAWRALPLALRRRLLRRAVATCCATPVEIGFRTIEAARRLAEGDASGRRVSLPGGVVMEVGYETLDFRRDPSPPTADWPQLASAIPLGLPVPGTVQLAGQWRLLAEPLKDVDLTAIAGNADPWMAYVALDDSAALVVRPRQPGERIRPLGLGGATRLKEVMIDRKIPAAARALWPLVATDEHPVWLAGHVLDERARVDEGSRRVVRLRLVRVKGE
jgi:tRNA(Ile)-lysidine synthase